MDLALAGRVAIVTGVSHGIGLAVSERLVAEGASVVGCSRSTPDGLPQGVDHLAVDLTDRPAADRLVALALERHGRLDVLVNNVGGGWFSRGYTDLDDDGWARMLDLNFLTAVRMVRAALPALARSGAGVVVNVSSINARSPSGSIPAYSAAKAALDNLTVGLATEVAADGIRVVGVAPGPVDTPLWLGEHGAGAMVAELTGRDKDEVIASAREAQPFGRFARPEEVAALVAFLASPLAGMVSGTTIPLDGGVTGVV